MLFFFIPRIFQQICNHFTKQWNSLVNNNRNDALFVSLPQSYNFTLVRWNIQADAEKFDFFQQDLVFVGHFCYIKAIQTQRRLYSLEFSETIKFIRRKSLLSQKDFAKALGVSFSTVNRWENDRAIPKICKLKLINEWYAYYESRHSGCHSSNQWYR